MSKIGGAGLIGVEGGWVVESSFLGAVVHLAVDVSGLEEEGAGEVGGPAI